MSKPLKPFQDDIAKIEAMAGIGLTNKEMSAILGISRSALDNRMLKDPEFKQAVLKGRAAAISNVAKTAYEMAVSGEIPVMTMFWLKTRAKWGVANESEQLVPEEREVEYDIEEDKQALLRLISDRR